MGVHMRGGNSCGLHYEWATGTSGLQVHIGQCLVISWAVVLCLPCDFPPRSKCPLILAASMHSSKNTMPTEPLCAALLLGLHR